MASRLQLIITKALAGLCKWFEHHPDTKAIGLYESLLSSIKMDGK
jgi:hypothetical protein